jgi:ribonuclease VapC
VVVDTSALVAILQGEPERRSFIDAIDAAEARLMSCATFVEISIVIEARYGVEGTRDLDRFIERAGITLVAVDEEQGRAARMAFSRFGKGRHRARLNYGDCFAYALAVESGEPLLFKGDDFFHTDVEVVRWAATA